MKKLHRLLGAFLAGALLFSSAGCGSKAPPAGGSSPDAGGEKVTIKFLHKWPQPENIGYFQSVVDGYEAEHPNVKIIMEGVADEPIKDKLRVLMGSSDQPDVFFSWSGEFANKFIAANAAYDLTAAMEENGGEWKNSFMRAGIEPFSKDGKYYGVPLRINGKFMIYNKEVFDKFGLKEPATWSEFMTVCETLKAGGVVPISFGNLYPWAACHYITGLNYKCVPKDVLEKDYNKATGEFTDPGYVKALELFAELGSKGYFNEFPNSKQHDMAQSTWTQGGEAMYYVELEEFKKNSEEFGKPWGFFPMPAIDGGAGEQNFLTGAPDGFMVSANSKHPDVAIDFLKYLTNVENAQKLVDELAWPSPVVGAVNLENSPEYLVKGMEAIQKADGMALWLDTDIHIKISDVYLPGLQELLNGAITPEALMAKVQAVAKEVQSLPE